MIIQKQAYARVGLIGNPSDGYYGKTISVIVRNFSAKVCCYESPRLTIHPHRSDRQVFDGLEDLAAEIQQNGYYGGMRLIKASIKRFSQYCEEGGIDLGGRTFTIEYDTDVPIRVGLAGSSAIITATMRALMEFYGVTIPKEILPGVILSVELDELEIGAGLQDRVIQVYEGAVFMDFDREYMKDHGHGKYEELDAGKLPPLFVAYHDRLAEGTEVVHNDLRSRWNRGDKEVVEAMKEFAGFAQSARDLLVAGRGGEIGELMNANFALRSRLVTISEGNRKLVETGRRFGAAVKFAGSGGAVIGCYDGDPKTLAKMREAYEAFGAKLIDPQTRAEQK